MSNVWQELFESRLRQMMREQFERTIVEFPTQHNVETMQEVLADLRRERETERIRADIEREIDMLRMGANIGFTRAHATPYQMFHHYDIDHLLDERRNIENGVKNEDELFELFVRNEISEETYLHYLPKFKLTKKEQMIQQARNKPRIKEKLKRLKPWQ